MKFKLFWAVIFEVIVHRVNNAECSYRNFVKKVNESVEFKCVTKDRQPGEVTWSKSNTTIDQTIADDKHMFFNTTTLKLLTLKHDDEGVYNCKIFGEIVGIYCLTVEVPPEISIYVNNKQPETVTWVENGVIINITCKAVGAKPAVNISWMLINGDHSDILQQTDIILEDGNNLTVTMSTISYKATKDLNVIECSSVGQITSTKATGINISTYDIYFIFDGSRVNTDVTISSSEIPNVTCVMTAAYPVNLSWVIDGDKYASNIVNTICNRDICTSSTNLELIHQATEDMYLSCISFGEHINQNVSSSIIIHLSARNNNTPPQDETQLPNLSKWIYSLIAIPAAFLGFLLFCWKRRRGKHANRMRVSKGTGQTSQSHTPENENLFELSSGKSTGSETTETYLQKETNDSENRSGILRKDVIIKSALSGNGFIKYSIGHHVTKEGKSTIIVKSVKDDAEVRDVYHFLKMADESSLLPRHPNIVEFLGVSKEEMPFYTYHEHVAGGSVRNYLLRNYQSSRISRTFINAIHFGNHQEANGAELCDFGVDVASGLNFLSTKKFNHPALSASKILLTLEGRCKLYDFWPSDISVDRIKRLVIQKNPPIAWLAPESIFLRQYHFKSDVWSFGVFLWEIFSFGEVPYKSLTGVEIEEAVRSSVHLNFPPDCPGAIFNIMLSSWNKDVEKRPSIHEIHTELQSLRQCPLKTTARSASTMAAPIDEDKTAHEKSHTYFMLNPDDEDYIEAS